jgi:hypothetical protein
MADDVHPASMTAGAACSELLSVNPPGAEKHFQASTFNGWLITKSLPALRDAVFAYLRSTVCFRQACVVRNAGLIPGGFAATTSR